MLRLATDADVHGEIVRGLRRRRTDIDLVRAQDALPVGSPDLDVLNWASLEQRVLITNDRNTFVGLAWRQVANGASLAGVIATTNQQSLGAAIDDILLVAECMTADEVRSRVVIFLPLRG
jgi:hypothetical protein